MILMVELRVEGKEVKNQKQAGGIFRCILQVPQRGLIKVFMY